PLGARAGPAVAQPQSHAFAGRKACGVGAHVAVRAFDDGVAAAEDRERRERHEAALRRDGARPAGGHGTRDRAVERSAILVETLAEPGEPHRRPGAPEAP